MLRIHFICPVPQHFVAAREERGAHCSDDSPRYNLKSSIKYTHPNGRGELKSA